MADIERKRKRDKSATSKSNKKEKVVASNSSSLSDNIHVSLLPEVDECAPIIVSTPGLSIKPSIPLQAYSRLRQKPLSHSGNGAISKSELLIQSSEHPTIDYVGREEEEGLTDKFLRHYVGVYDPESGSLQLMEARKLAVRGIVRARQAAPESLQERGVTANMRAMRNDLGQEFGTKKSKKAIASLTENAISSIPIVRDGPNAAPKKLDSTTKALLDTMKDATSNIATRAELTAAADEAKPRPKANLAATNVTDVYTIESLVGLDIIKAVSVKDWQDAVKANEEVISKSRYVAHRLSTAATDVTKLKVLRYIECLLTFFNACKPRRSSRQLPKREDMRSIMAGVPETVTSHITRKFSTSGEMSKFQIDLAITHLCALSFIVDNFELDTMDLKDDLKLEPKAMANYYSEIGARISALSKGEAVKLGLDTAAASQRKIAKLRLPLEFPKARFARK